MRHFIVGQSSLAFEFVHVKCFCMFIIDTSIEVSAIIRVQGIVAFCSRANGVSNAFFYMNLLKIILLHQLLNTKKSFQYRKLFLRRIISNKYSLPILPNLREGRGRLGIWSSFLQQSEKTAVNNLTSFTYVDIRAKTMIKL